MSTSTVRHFALPRYITFASPLSALYNNRMTNAERQRRFYAKHKEERAREREILGASTYNDYHKRYYEKLKAKKKIISEENK